MYIKKIRLGADEMARLMTTKECRILDKLVIASIYEVWGVKGYFVKVMRVDENGSTIRTTEEQLTNTCRVKKKKELRKVSVMSKLDEGMFVGGKSKFDIGEQVAVAESYLNITMRLGDEGYKFIMEALGVQERKDIRKLPSWGNAKYVEPSAMVRRIEVIDCKICRVSEITREEWFSLGVDWINSDMEIDRKTRCVGRHALEMDSEVVLYKYKTLRGSVQGKFDAMTYKERDEYAKKLWREKLK